MENPPFVIIVEGFPATLIFCAASSDLDRADALGAATAPLRKVLRQAQHGPADGAERQRCAKMLEVQQEAQKLETTVRELTYAWQQTDAEVKVYISFDQSEDIG
eukprot:Skav227088  [mRNA]  locus=scaffold1387:336967:339855:- [translate_table: standard]